MLRAAVPPLLLNDERIGTVVFVALIDVAVCTWSIYCSLTQHSSLALELFAKNSTAQAIASFQVFPCSLGSRPSKSLALKETLDTKNQPNSSMSKKSTTDTASIAAILQQTAALLKSQEEALKAQAAAQEKTNALLEKLLARGPIESASATPNKKAKKGSRGL